MASPLGFLILLGIAYYLCCCWGDWERSREGQLFPKSRPLVRLPRLAYLLGLLSLSLLAAITIGGHAGAGSKADPLTVASVTAATGDWVIAAVASRNGTDADSCISSVTWGATTLSSDAECIYGTSDPQANILSARVTSGSTETVTVNFIADCQSTGHAVRVAVLTGLPTSSPVDVSGTATDASWSSSSELSPSLVTTVASTIIIVVYAPESDSGSGPTDWNASGFSTSGYSESTGAAETSNVASIMGYLIASSTGTYQADIDTAGTMVNVNSCKIAVAYKEDGGGPAAPTGEQYKKKKLRLLSQARVN